MALGSRILALTAVMACLVHLAAAHGYLGIPASRNLLHNTDYCPHCLNAGGVWTVSLNGQLSWPDARHGMCGDPYNGEQKHMQGGVSATGTVTGNYAPGSVMSINIILTTFHNGRYRFRVCKMSATGNEFSDLTEGCLDQHVLVQANVPGAQAPGEMWFYPDGSYSQTMYYQLPAGLTCDGASDKCILQWNYLTGNTCTPPGTPAQHANSALPICATPQAQYPEEFWNCADITIGGSGDVVQTPQGSGSQPAVQATPSSHQAGNATQEGRSASPSGPCGAQDAQCGCEGKSAGNHGDVAGGCVGFFSCADNVRAYIACPSGLLYRKDLDTCDYPDKVPDCPAQG